MNKDIIGTKIFKRYKYSVGTIFSNILFWFCVYFSLFLLAFTLCFTSSFVQGDSMRPTINDYEDYEHKSDIVYLNKLADYTYGDIIVVQKPDVQVIKRVIGLPGDTIDIVPKQETQSGVQVIRYYVERNGVAISEGYIRNVPSNTSDPNGMMAAYNRFEDFKQENPQLNYTESGALIVGEDEVFVLGDNRATSKDSSEAGCYKIANVLGKVEIIVYFNHNIVWELLKYFFWPF